MLHILGDTYAGGIWVEFNFGKDLANVIVRYFVPFLAIGAIALVIIIGIRFAMAKDEKTREEEKKRHKLRKRQYLFTLFYLRK